MNHLIKQMLQTTPSLGRNSHSLGFGVPNNLNSSLELSWQVEDDGKGLEDREPVPKDRQRGVSVRHSLQQ